MIYQLSSGPLWIRYFRTHKSPLCEISLFLNVFEMILFNHQIRLKDQILIL
jgi:hypothetical protein